jgi:hypothetical protein
MARVRLDAEGSRCRIYALDSLLRSAEGGGLRRARLGSTATLMDLADSRGSTAQKYRNRPGPGWIGVDAVGR